MPNRSDDTSTAESTREDECRIRVRGLDLTEHNPRTGRQAREPKKDCKHEYNDVSTLSYV